MQDNTIEVCLGVGMNQLFPEVVKIEILPEENSTNENNDSDGEA